MEMANPRSGHQRTQQKHKHQQMVILTKAAERPGLPAERCLGQLLSQDKEGTSYRESLETAIRSSMWPVVLRIMAVLCCRRVCPHTLSCWLLAGLPEAGCHLGVLLIAPGSMLQTPDRGDRSYLYWTMRKAQAPRCWVTWSKYQDQI